MKFETALDMAAGTSPAVCASPGTYRIRNGKIPMRSQATLKGMQKKQNTFTLNMNSMSTNAFGLGVSAKGLEGLGGLGGGNPLLVNNGVNQRY